MAGTFPSIRLQQVTRTLSVPTRVVQFLDDTEQRWRCADPLNAWALTFTGMSAADRDSLRNFVATQKGAYDSSWTFGFFLVNYTNMAFEDDSFVEVESQPRRWDCSVKFRQTAKSGTYASGLTAVYPTINGGVVTQRPFTRRKTFLTTRNDVPTGKRYAWYERGNPLASWVCDYSAITGLELIALCDFFVSMGGQYGEFTFTDPEDATVHTKCRFAQDDFSARYIGPNHAAVTLAIQEYA